MTHLIMINGSLSRLASVVHSNGKLLEKILMSDCRMRVLAMPLPNLPSPFMQLLPSTNLEDLALAEELLSNNANSESLKNREELVSFSLFACNKIIIVNNII